MCVCVFRKMKTLRRLVRCWIIVFALSLLVSEGEMWPQNLGSTNLRSPTIGDNKQTSDNTVPQSPRPAPSRPAPQRRVEPPAEEASRAGDAARRPSPPPREEKKPDKPAPPRQGQNGRSQGGPGFNPIDLISTTMQIAQMAQNEARRPEQGPQPNWNQGLRPSSRPSYMEPVPRGNPSTTNFTFPNKRPDRNGKPSNSRPDVGNPIVFPDPPRFVPSESCVKSGLTFCETRSDYPSEHIAKVLDSTMASRFGSLFGADEVEVRSNITQRFDSPNDEETLCRSQERVIYPTAGQTKDDQWKFIVNQEKFLQGVRIEMCMEEDGKCMFSDSFPFGYHSFCKQKYIYRKLVSVTADGTSSTDEFKLPSCCSCHIRLDTSMRMAADISKPERNKRRLKDHRPRL